MSIIEKFRECPKVAVAKKNYWIIYMKITMILNVNLMEMSVRSSKNAIVIFAFTATWK